ncbi:hypothetical protein BOTCAL_0417g00130 [Botryotinia calthae]|uniref:Uncharacterized protein n=1 Tax=Botryotinia calthae TaxID=38488 RepID=A0A4Y8CS88_9HELO|nr:hypothetical protein BOTCAL_0417g00130 [Botryotinia calthae]
MLEHTFELKLQQNINALVSFEYLNLGSTMFVSVSMKIEKVNSGDGSGEYIRSSTGHRRGDDGDRSDINDWSKSSTPTILNESPKLLKIGTKTEAVSKATTEEIDEAITTTNAAL